MTDRVFICNQNNIDDPGSRGFTVKVNDEDINGFIVHKDGLFFAYRNSCPHTGSPLDWVEHQFLDMDGRLIQCAVHDARFNIENGLCLAGPCSGESLQGLKIIQQDNQLFIQI